MKNGRTRWIQDSMWQYVIASYLIFWVMVLGICGTASMVFGASPLTMRWLANLCAWSPTLVLFFMFRKLQPGSTIKEFYKKAFSGRIRVDLFLVSGLTVVAGILFSVWVLSFWEGRSFTTFFDQGSYALPLAFLLSFLSGPTGEESGWRGYLRLELEDRFGFLKGSLVLGAVWAFWHAVLWFVDSDFQGMELLPYMLSNVIVLTSLTIIMNVVMKKSENLLYPVWIHLCFNFLYVFLKVEIGFYIILSAVFAAIAGGYLFYYFRGEKAGEFPR